jgi:transposase-like protein
MSKHRKRWTATEKAEIVSYYKEHGIGKASAEFDVSATSIYNWEAKLEGLVSDMDLNNEKTYKNQLKKMEREMLRLKLLVADQALEINIKDELLKKKKSQK